MIDETAKNIACAVIKQAAMDYRNPKMRESVECFFKSNRANLYLEIADVNLTGDEIIKQLRLEVGND